MRRGTPSGTKGSTMFSAGAELGSDGKALGRFGEKGTAAGQFQMPHMLCVDSRGDVYVAEVTNKRVQKFTAKE